MSVKTREQLRDDLAADHASDPYDCGNSRADQEYSFVDGFNAGLTVADANPPEYVKALVEALESIYKSNDGSAYVAFEINKIVSEALTAYHQATKGGSTK